MSAPSTSGPPARPLTPEDPPRVDGFWLDARLHAEPAGVAYRAHDAEREVVLVLLSAGAASERVARDRFTGIIEPLHIDLIVAVGGEGQDVGRLARRFHPADAPVADGEGAPWVALPAGQEELAEHLLAEVGLSLLGPQGRPAGPDYALPWADRTAPGRSPLWPLPWPGRHDRAGWVTLFVSWLLTILLAALAILIAILLFRNEPPQSPPPPQPQSASASASSSSSSSSSPSPSPSSSSPSPSSASPSPTGSGSPSPASATPSAGAYSSPRSRL